jgi:hypothetical protein
MNNRDRFSPILAALIGGAVGALAVYLSDHKHREKIVKKIEDLIETGEEKGSELKKNIDSSIRTGRKTLAKKIRQVEEKIAQD